MSSRVRILCREGRLWVTREGDSRDILLKGGGSYSVEGGGLVIVQPLGDAAVVVEWGRGERLVVLTESVRSRSSASLAADKASHEPEIEHEPPSPDKNDDDQGDRKAEEGQVGEGRIRLRPGCGDGDAK